LDGGQLALAWIGVGWR